MSEVKHARMTSMTRIGFIKDLPFKVPAAPTYPFQAVGLVQIAPSRQAFWQAPGARGPLTCG
jgi:hypothetical protein